MLGSNVEEFHGRPVKDWTPNDAAKFDLKTTIPRLRVNLYTIQDELIEEAGGEQLRQLQNAATEQLQKQSQQENFSIDSPAMTIWSEYHTQRNAIRQRLEKEKPEYFGAGVMVSWLKQLAESAGAEQLPALVIGMWGEGTTSSADLVTALAELKDRFPALRGLFIGDIVSEENEISWIQQSNLSALWVAYPKLTELRLRGGTELRTGLIELPELESLIIEAGGLSKELVAEVLLSPLPALRHLELWLGTKDYGGTSTASQFRRLSLPNMPALKSLGLRDCDYADELAGVIGAAPVVERLDKLDLSLGTMGDEGATALIASPAIWRLKELDLQYHYISEGAGVALSAVVPRVNLDNRQKEEEYGRNVAVGE